MKNLNVTKRGNVYHYRFEVEVVKSIRTVAVETNSINSLHDFYKNENMHNSAFRYKLDTTYKT